jgi:hypothetical protein
MLIITLENEKTSLIHSLREFLPATTQLPRFLHLSDADISDTRDTVPKQYTIHPEFTPAPRTLSRPNTIQATRRPYDITQAPQHQHDQPLTSEQPHILNLDLITPEHLNTTSTTTSTTPVMHEYSELPFELRKKRNIFTPVLSYLTHQPPRNFLSNFFTKF